MRQRSLKAVHELAKKDSRVVFIGSDLGHGTLDAMRTEMPDRFFMEGISEQHIVTMAAGMALEGYIPYVNTIATFFARRACEQIILDLCLHKTRVRLIASGGGVVYAPLGPTHLEIEDFALLRPLPNMTIIAPADAEEMGRLMPQTLEVDGPVYIRLAKGGDPVLSNPELPCEIGKGIVVDHRGSDALIVTTGITLGIALDASERLSRENILCTVAHFHTLKPLDINLLETLLRETNCVLSVEEHVRIGGLGSAVAEVIAESDNSHGIRLERIGLPDRFPDRYGTQAQLLDHYGISSDVLQNKIKAALVSRRSKFS